MRNTRVVRRVRLEANRKDIVAVVASDVEVIGTGLIVLKMKSSQLKLGDMLGSHKSEAMELLAGLWKLRKLRDGLASTGSGVSEHRED